MSNANNKMPYKPYFMEGLTPDLIKRAEEELGETAELRTQSLKDFKRLIKEEPDFRPCMEDVFLLRFLRTKKYNAERAFKTLKTYYTFKARYSGIITDFKPSEAKEFFNACEGGALFYRGLNDTALGIIRIGKFHKRKFSVDELFAGIMMGTEIGLSIEASQITGYSMVLDFTDFDLSMLKVYATPSLLYRFIFAIQDCIPCRVKSFHIINEPLYFSIIFNIAKTLLSDKLGKRVFVHGNDLKSLHKYIPADVLPEELGGKQPLHTKFLREVYNPHVFGMEEHFTKMNKFGYQGETLRQFRKDNPKAIYT